MVSPSTICFPNNKVLMNESYVAEEARAMLQGVGSRFDFHMNKTLCDLRYLAIDIDGFLSLTLLQEHGRFLTSSLNFQNRWEHCTTLGFVHFLTSILNIWS